MDNATELLSNCCGASMDGEAFNNSGIEEYGIQGYCADCKEAAVFEEVAA